MTRPPCEPKGQWPACFVAVLVVFALLVFFCGRGHAKPLHSCIGMEPPTLSFKGAERRGLWHIAKPTCYIPLPKTSQEDRHARGQ